VLHKDTTTTQTNKLHFLNRTTEKQILLHIDHNNEHESTLLQRILTTPPRLQHNIFAESLTLHAKKYLTRLQNHTNQHHKKRQALHGWNRLPATTRHPTTTTTYDLNAFHDTHHNHDTTPTQPNQHTRQTNPPLQVTPQTRLTTEQHDIKITPHRTATPCPLAQG
jgi:hypothetical protein